MKFGKRLAAEARRRWGDAEGGAGAYLDYHALKAAIKADVAARDPRGPRFDALLAAELRKVAAFYAEKEEELGAAVGTLSHACSPEEVAALRIELTDLRRYCALNYMAVIKAAKKRNRHLRAACGDAAVAPLRALPVLSAQRFFTSGRLAALSTRAEVLAQELAPAAQPPAAVLEDYTCPICMDVLRGPVVLTCAHRFCWGCLLAHATAAAQAGGGHGCGSKPPGKAAAAAAELEAPPAGSSSSSGGSRSSSSTVTELQSPEHLQQEQADGEGEGEAGTTCTVDCAVCRKTQLLNLERLQVDPHLEAFLQRLQSQQQRSSSSAVPIPIGGASPRSVLPADDIGLPPRARASAASLAEVSKEQAAPATDPAIAVPAPAPAPAASAVPAAPLLPPQRPEHRGRLVVCLDLDGTLVTTFTPKRAPRLPPSAVSYVVGRGGALNPGGVFVVERPGLGEFLRSIAPFAEVVLFTAGLEDYAAPICDAIEARYGPGAFHHRLYRPATTAVDNVYPCVKDMSRLGRQLSRCVLVDDTPLAFWAQPDHGIPVLQYRGDQDDRMLTEAVGPLLEQLAGAADVCDPLARRFQMQRWFAAQGVALPAAAPAAHALPRPASMPRLKVPAAPAPAAGVFSEPSSVELLRGGAGAASLLVCDFDKTLLDYDAGERVCDELAPELTSLLSTVAECADFIPVTNTVLSEMQRRGVSRDALVSCLREVGREVPAATVRLLQWAAARGLDTTILSDCNSMFISHILMGAKAGQYVRHIITNPAAFQRVHAPSTPQLADADADAAAPTPTPTPAPRPSFGGWFGFRQASSGASAPSSAGAAPAPAKAPLSNSHRLVIEPRYGYEACGSHGCALCPRNLCKGRELAALRAAAPGRRVVYCGDGANDLCPALALGPQDVVLARAGHPLERLLTQRAAAAAAGEPGAGPPAAAAVYSWRTHDELFRLVQSHA